MQNPLFDLLSFFLLPLTCISQQLSYVQRPLRFRWLADYPEVGARTSECRTRTLQIRNERRIGVRVCRYGRVHSDKQENFACLDLDLPASMSPRRKSKSKTPLSRDCQHSRQATSDQRVERRTQQSRGSGRDPLPEVSIGGR